MHKAVSIWDLIPGFKSYNIISSANEYMNIIKRKWSWSLDIIYLNWGERDEDIVDTESPLRILYGL